jgi:hypothetical protein
MARTLAELPAGNRIADFIGLGVVARFFPVEKIHDVLEQSKRASVRERDLPAHVVVYICHRAGAVSCFHLFR